MMIADNTPITIAIAESMPSSLRLIGQPGFTKSWRRMLYTPKRMRGSVIRWNAPELRSGAIEYKQAKARRQNPRTASLFRDLITPRPQKKNAVANATYEAISSGVSSFYLKEIAGEC